MNNDTGKGGEPVDRWEYDRIRMREDGIRMPTGRTQGYFGACPYIYDTVCICPGYSKLIKGYGCDKQEYNQPLQWKACEYYIKRRAEVLAVTDERPFNVDNISEAVRGAERALM